MACILVRRLLPLSLVSPSFAADSQWIPIGPEGGFLLSFAIAPSSPTVLYGGSDAYGGIYKSTDSGETWEFMGLISHLGEILDIAIHPDSCDIVYAACSSGGVYRTTDGGENWFPVNNGLMDRMVREVKGDPVSPNTLYVTTDGLGGVYKSTDGAASWTQRSSGMPLHACSGDMF